MTNWLVLFRAINVGGNNIIPMKALQQMLENMGCRQVQTYIQTGNVWLQAEEQNAQLLSQQIVDQVKQTFNCAAQILLLDEQAFNQAVQNNPFTEVELKTVHWFFLLESAHQPDLTALQAVKKESESFQLIDNVFYLHAPEGIGRSKLVTKVEKCLAVPCTARNGNTINKVLALLEK